MPSEHMAMSAYTSEAERELALEAALQKGDERLINYHMRLLMEAGTSGEEQFREQFDWLPEAIHAAG